MAIRVGDRAPDARVRDAQEHELALSSLWRDAPLVLLFLRHFG